MKHKVRLKVVAQEHGFDADGGEVKEGSTVVDDQRMLCLAVLEKSSVEKPIASLRKLTETVSV